jgi:hypothetical protein
VFVLCGQRWITLLVRDKLGFYRQQWFLGKPVGQKAAAEMIHLVFVSRPEALPTAETLTTERTWF